MLLRKLSTVSERLPRAVNSLVLKLRGLQAQNSGTLLECIEGLLNKHKVTLMKHYSIKDNTLLWKKVSSSIDETSLFLKNDLPLHNQSQYEDFIKALIPTDSKSLPLSSKNPQILNIVSNLMKNYSVNHNKLYLKYIELPQLPTHIYPLLLRKFLYHAHNFVRPNAMSISYLSLNPPPQKAISIFNDMLSYRQEYIRMVTHIMNDMRRFNLKLSLKDQNQLIYISYFKDAPEIVEKIETMYQYVQNQNTNSPNYHPSQLKKYPDFSFEVYTSLKSSIVPDIDTYNIFLFHGIRHDNQEIINDVLNMIDFNHNIEKSVTNEEANTTMPTEEVVQTSSPVNTHSNSVDSPKLLRPNSQLFKTLLDYYSSSSYLQKSKSYESLIKCIENILKSDIIFDVKLINKIIKSLVATNHILQAESLVTVFYIQEVDGLETVMSKQLTPEDKFVYSRLLAMFRQIKSVTLDDANFEMIPTESTFIPLIKHYTENQNIEKLKIILKVMKESYKLPITTRVYKSIFVGFTKDLGSLSDLIEILGDMLSNHDYTYAMSQDSRIKDFSSNLSSSLQSFVENHLQTSETISIPTDRGSFIKFSDDLMYLIYDACISTVETDNDIRSKEKLMLQIHDQKMNLEETLLMIRNDEKDKYFSMKSNIYENDELIYLKKGFLIDLMDLVDSYRNGEN